MANHRLLARVVGFWLAPRDERGLSQSTESVILLVGAVAIAAVVISVVTTFVKNNLVLTP